jgi:hypothetical protein
MKQYLLSVHMVEGEPLPSDAEIQQRYRDVDAFNGEVQQAGAWVFGGGLHSPSTATVVRSQGGQVVTTDGPFAEAKEQLAGFYLVETETLDKAVEYAAMIPEASGFGIVEVRPVMDLSALGI